MSSYLACPLPLPGSKSERNSAALGGGKRKLGLCRCSLSTAGRERGHVHRGRLKRAISGPVPLLSSRSHTIMDHPYPALSSLIHLGPTRAGPTCTLPHQDLGIRGFMWYTDGWGMRGGWEAQDAADDCKKKMAELVAAP